MASWLARGWALVPGSPVAHVPYPVGLCCFLAPPFLWDSEQVLGPCSTSCRFWGRGAPTGCRSTGTVAVTHQLCSLFRGVQLGVYLLLAGSVGKVAVVHVPLEHGCSVPLSVWMLWGRLPNMGSVLSTAAFPSASQGRALVCAPRRGQTLDQFCHLADRAGFSLRCHEDYDAHVSRLHAKVSLLPAPVTLILALSPKIAVFTVG